MKLKSLMMVVVLAAFSVSVTAADAGTKMTFWLVYKVSQKGLTYNNNKDKATKDPTKCWILVPLLGDGNTLANEKVAGGVSLIEQTSTTSGTQVDLPGLVLFSFSVASGKKASTFGQGYNVDDKAATQRLYSLAGVGAPAKGVNPSDKKAYLAWSSKLTGSFSDMFISDTTPWVDAGTWNCTLDAKTSAAMTGSIDPSKSVSENYTIAMPIFVQTAKLKFTPTSI